MKTSFLLISLLFSFTLNAGVFKLAVITSEFDQNVTDYFLETNDQNMIISMRYVTTMPNGGIFEDVSVPVERVINDGIVIVERNGLEAVRLELENFDLKKGGVVKLNYLFNGVSGIRRLKRFTLKPDNQQYNLFDQDNNRVNKMFLEANRVRIFGVVGIKTILTSFSTFHFQQN
jgi:hypothetical protein